MFDTRARGRLPANEWTMVPKQVMVYADADDDPGGRPNVGGAA